jgi:hypothetical protein
MADKYLPAFPHTIEHLHEPMTTGMTLRDYFAARAMQVLLSAVDVDISDRQWMAERAYAFADTMLKVREES